MQNILEVFLLLPLMNEKLLPLDSELREHERWAVMVQKCTGGSVSEIPVRLSLTFAIFLILLYIKYPSEN